MMPRGKINNSILNERATKPKYIHVPLDPNTRRILGIAQEQYKAKNQTALIRRIILDWYHYRRVAKGYKDELKKLAHEIEFLNRRLTERIEEVDKKLIDINGELALIKESLASIERKLS